MIASSVELLAVDLRGTQVTDDVVGRLFASLLDLVEKVPMQLVRCDQPAFDVGLYRDEAERQPPKHIEIFAGESE